MIPPRLSARFASSMASVFISYRHENDAHCQRVRQLAIKLRDAGVDVIFDIFEEDKHKSTSLAPPNGWAMWSIQQASNPDHKVIIVASNGWFQSVNHHVPSPTDGKGAAAEAECIVTRMYREAGNSFSIMTYFDRDADLAELPAYLEKCSRLDATKDVNIDKIITWAKGIAPLPVTGAPAPAIIWPSSVCFPPHALADRRDQCAFFCAMLNGTAPESVACVIAESGTGKSRLLEVLKDAASSALAAADRVAYVRNLQEKTVDSLVADLCSALGGYACFQSYEASVEQAKPEKAQHIAFFRDLRARTAPSFIILDTWDKATDELREWIKGHFVPEVLRSPAVKLAIAGQPRTDYPPAQAGAVQTFSLHHIEQSDWHAFIDVRYPAEAVALKQTIDLCLARAHGVKVIANILELIDKGGVVI